MTEHIYTLGRQEIIRGYKSFERILCSGKKLNSGSVSGIINITEPSAGFPVQVGFLLSKKKLKELSAETV